MLTISNDVADKMLEQGQDGKAVDIIQIVGDYALVNAVGAGFG